MWKWLDDLLNKPYKSAAADLDKKLALDCWKREMEVRYQGMVSEPVLTFVEYATKNPKNFKLTRTVNYNCYGWQEPTGFIIVTDKVLGDSWEIYISVRQNTIQRGRANEGYLTDSLYSVSNLPFSLNGWELRYLYDKLAPIFKRTKARERKAQIIASQVQRQRVELERQEQVYRDQYFNKYKELV